MLIALFAASLFYLYYVILRNQKALKTRVEKRIQRVDTHRKPPAWR